MPAVLTQAQKDRKNELARTRRAEKSKAEQGESLGPVVNPDGSATAVTIGMLTGQKDELAEAVDLVFQTKKGKDVIAPRGGIPTKVVQKYRDGSRLLTGDGRQIKRDAMCEHELPEGYTGQYFEVVGGPIAGTHGWVHRARGCNRPYQIG